MIKIRSRFGTDHKTALGTSPPSDTLGGAAVNFIDYIGVMKILRTLIAPLALILLAAPAWADKIPLNTISAYLNSLTTAESDFTQVNADGSIATGKLYIKRPNRARFEYAPPDKSLVLASGGQVAIFDSKSNQPPEQYPLKRTPLNLILAANVDLGRAKMVVAHTEDKNATSVVAQDPEHPEYGSIALVFTANPTALRQWVITDDLGQQTTVILADLKAGKAYKASLFAIESELQKRGQ
jgi:outer membrane lipoprotein-sorting protein